MPIILAPTYEPECEAQDEVDQPPIDESVLEVAAWMAEVFRRDGELAQRRAVNEIFHRFGNRFVYINDNGNRAIHPHVLDAFRELTEPEAVWDELRWRLRQPTDPPFGRKA